MNILLLDNYDSFTYNIAHIVRELGSTNAFHGGITLDVVRNDKLSLDAVESYDAVILSPGPGIPKEAGIMPALIQRYAPTKPILGVCLGEQAIGEAFGGSLLNLPTVFHGVATTTRICGDTEPYDAVLFRGLPREIKVGRYHSWVVDAANVPSDLLVTAVDEHGYIMALRHKTYNVRGVQFHPESVLTEHGATMLRNWLDALPFR
jgi:anthranilate synthase component 2